MIILHANIKQNPSENVALFIFFVLYDGLPMVLWCQIYIFTNEPLLTLPWTDLVATHSPTVQPHPPHTHTHCKKRFAILPSPAGMSLTKLSLNGNNLIIPAQGEFGL
jgi:hypothetical protein